MYTTLPSILPFLPILLIPITTASALPHLTRRDNTQPVGTNPITEITFTVQFLGQQKASNSCSHRDLGFTGSLGGQWYAVYGDTLWCASGVTDPDLDAEGFHGMVRDAVSLTTSDPLVVVDLNLNDDTPVAHQNQFIPFDASLGETAQYGFGGTSIVESDVQGVGGVYYLVNANEAGLKGAGIAKVELRDGTPTVTQRFGTPGYWWESTNVARYGDVAAFRDPRSEYVYAYGGAPTRITSWPENQYVYAVRVKASEMFDLSKYEYYWGEQGWKSEVLTQFDSTTAMWWQVGQGQIVWSQFFQCYIFVHLSGNTVVLRTAPSPEGPWTADVELYTDIPIDDGFVYAGVAHPHLDTSGKSLVISWTNNNHIHVLRVTFDGSGAAHVDSASATSALDSDSDSDLADDLKMAALQPDTTSPTIVASDNSGVTPTPFLPVEDGRDGEETSTIPTKSETFEPDDPILPTETPKSSSMEVFPTILDPSSSVEVFPTMSADPTSSDAVEEPTATASATPTRKHCGGERRHRGGHHSHH